MRCSIASCIRLGQINPTSAWRGGAKPQTTRLALPRGGFLDVQVDKPTVLLPGHAERYIAGQVLGRSTDQCTTLTLSSAATPAYFSAAATLIVL